MTIVSPSVLSADFMNLKQQMDQINESKAQWLHYDVMDGHFVPNLTFGTAILKQVAKATNKLLDVHIMVSNPLQVIDYFGDIDIYMMTFHYEAVSDFTMLPVIEKIRSKGWKVGISIKPDTKPEALIDVLDKVDMVLVMSVNPGFGGQKFMPQALEKLDWLHQYRVAHNLDYLLQIDGGINAETGKLAVEHHCDSLVAGNHVFKYPEGIVKGVESLL